MEIIFNLSTCLLTRNFCVNARGNAGRGNTFPTLGSVGPPMNTKRDSCRYQTVHTNKMWNN